MEKVDKEEFKQLQFVRSIRRMGRLSKGFLRLVKDLVLKNPYKYAIFYVCLTFKDNKEFDNAKFETGNSPMGRYMWYLKRYLLNHGYKLYAYFWVLESQSRGVPHYHIFLVTDSRAYIPYPDKSFWPWGMSQIQRVPCRKVSISYLVKYLKKEEQKLSMYGNFTFRNMRKYTMYINREWKDKFFYVITSGYSRVRRWVARKIGQYVVKRKGWWTFDGSDSFRYKIHATFFFFGQYVYKDIGAVTVNVNDEFIKFGSIDEFMNALDFVYES